MRGVDDAIDEHRHRRASNLQHLAGVVFDAQNDVQDTTLFCGERICPLQKCGDRTDFANGQLDKGIGFFTRVHYASKLRKKKVLVKERISARLWLFRHETIQSVAQKRP